MKRLLYHSMLAACILFACKSKSNCIIPVTQANHYVDTLRYLALGDSYTFGQNVATNLTFPAQLFKRLVDTLTPMVSSIKIIATTGWTTTQLLNAIDQQKPAGNNEMVTLLIGVNNQYQGLPYSFYINEFNQLLQRA